MARTFTGKTHSSPATVSTTPAGRNTPLRAGRGASEPTWWLLMNSARGSSSPVRCTCTSGSGPTARSVAAQSPMRCSATSAHHRARSLAPSRRARSWSSTFSAPAATEKGGRLAAATGTPGCSTGAEWSTSARGYRPPPEYRTTRSPCRTAASARHTCSASCTTRSAPASASATGASRSSAAQSAISGSSSPAPPTPAVAYAVTRISPWSPPAPRPSPPSSSSSSPPSAGGGSGPTGTHSCAPGRRSPTSRGAPPSSRTARASASASTSAAMTCTSAPRPASSAASAAAFFRPPAPGRTPTAAVYPRSAPGSAAPAAARAMTAAMTPRRRPTGAARRASAVVVAVTIESESESEPTAGDRRAGGRDGTGRDEARRARDEGPRGARAACAHARREREGGREQSERT